MWLSTKFGFAAHVGARLGRVNRLAAINGREAAAEFAIEFRQLGSTGLVVLFQEPESLADDFTRRVVTA